MPYFLPFCTLVYVTVRNFLMGESSNALLVKISLNRFFCSIQTWMKEIHVVPFHYVFLEMLWDDYLSLCVTRYIVFRPL